MKTGIPPQTGWPSVRVTPSQPERVGSKPLLSSARNSSIVNRQKKLIENLKAATSQILGSINNLSPDQKAQCLKHIKQPANTQWKEGSIEAGKGGQLISKNAIGSHREETIFYAMQETFNQSDDIPASDAKPLIDMSKRGPRLFAKNTEAHQSFLAKENDKDRSKIHASLLPPAIEVIVNDPQPHKIEITEMPKPQKASVLNPVKTNTVNLTAAELGVAKLTPKKIS